MGACYINYIKDKSFWEALMNFSGLNPPKIVLMLLYVTLICQDFAHKEVLIP